MPRLTGGGYGSRQVSHVKTGKTEPIPHKASPAGAAQQGMAVQFRKEPLQQGRGYEPAKQGDTGIAQAKYNPATTGPGSLRTTYRSGSQSPTPPAKEMPAGRDTLAEYGPEISGPSRRR
jgi:hypothetical protein